MRFAIVTPSFNKASYIRRCVEGVMAQTHQDFDYWILDNCSTDGSQEILGELQRTYGARIHVLIEPDKGQSAAINKGFALARGEAMAWLCADDFWVADALETANRVLTENPATALVYGDADVVDRNGAWVGRFPSRLPSLRKLQSFDYICQPAAFWTQPAWDSVGPLTESLNWGMDWDLFIRLTKCFPTQYIPHKFADVVQDGDNKTTLGGDLRTRELARISKMHGGFFEPTFLYCHYTLFLEETFAPLLGRVTSKAFAKRQILRLKSYAMTFLSRYFDAEVMA